MRTGYHIIALLIGAALFAGPAAGQTYELVESSVSSGGGTSGDDTQVTSTVGQVSPAGFSEDGGLRLFSGYPSPLLDIVPLIAQLQDLAEEVPERGTDVSIRATIDNRLADVESATLRYRRGDETEVANAVDMEEAEDGTYEATIPGEDVGETSVAYFVEAEDAAENTARAPTGDDAVASFPVRISEGLDRGTRQAGGESPTNYRLVSVPLEPDDAGVEDVFGDELGSYDGGDTWRFFRPEGDDPGTYLEGRQISAIEPGAAYWLIVREDLDDFNTGAGNVQRVDGPVEVDLEEGWNFVANPFAFPLSAGQVRLEDDEAELALSAYDGDWSNPTTDPVETLEPFTGYALNVESDQTLTFDPRPEETPDDDALRAKATGTEEEPLWHVRIVGQSGAVQDGSAVAAAVPGASPQRDDADRPRPPSLGEGLQVAFERSSWDGPHTYYMTDARPEPAQGTVWPFEVQVDQEEDVRLSFEHLDTVPDDFEVWLLDEGLETAHNLRESNRYTISRPSPDEAYAYQLIVGTSAFVESELDAAGALPDEYVLDGVFPNPSRGAVSVRYGLPETERVTLEVYNTLGQRVTTLMQDELREAGFHIEQWDGRQANGAPVASGTYFLRMRAGDFTETVQFVRVN